MSPTQNFLLACGFAVVCLPMVIIITFREWPQQSRAIWRWLTHPVRMLALVILAISVPAIIQHTVRTRYTYRSYGNLTMKIDTWTGREWIGAGNNWRPIPPP